MPERIILDTVQHAITTRYRKTIWRKFLSAMQRYQMTRPGDRIAVCYSGGKDSLLLAKCMQTLQKYSTVPFEVVYLHMDPGYSPENRQKVMDTANKLGITPEVFHTDIYQVINGVKQSPCHVCAAMRRGHLYKAARQSGCNKIALGHHYDDAAETLLMGMLYGGEFKAMLPRLRSENYLGMELIRPLYLVRERAVAAWKDEFALDTVTCACRVTQQEGGGKRKEVKELLRSLEKRQANVIDNIMASASRVSLSTLLGYRQTADSPVTTFLDHSFQDDNASEDIVNQYF
ncbi:MAG: ATP-binding protein [Eubacteriales bacterium]|nr:ATP-binding protein [Eubacteriales bacterium]